MKSIMLIPVIAMMMVSCKSDGDKAVTAQDATALKIEALEQQLEQQKMETVKQTAIDSMQMINELKLPIDIAAAPAPAPVRTKVVYVREPKREVTQTPAAQVPAPTPTITETPTVAEVPSPAEKAPVATAPAEPAKKKGWSNTAKGAVIGAGAGAIGGAVISKNNRVKGAVIGGIIGAVAGAGTGVILDKKKKKNEMQLFPEN